jgi:hypothetical protein
MTLKNQSVATQAKGEDRGLAQLIPDFAACELMWRMGLNCQKEDNNNIPERWHQSQEIEPCSGGGGGREARAGACAGRVVCMVCGY